jgi:hypothetical protein
MVGWNNSCAIGYCVVCRSIRSSHRAIEAKKASKIDEQDLSGDLCGSTIFLQ